MTKAKASESEGSATGSVEQSSLQYLKGVGPKRASALKSIGIQSAEDLLFYFPRGYLDRSTIVPIDQLRHRAGENAPVTVIGEVFRVEARRSKRSRRLILFVTVKDSTGNLPCVWFEGVEWYKDAFANGELLALSAVPTFDNLGRVQFVHPEFDRLKGALEEDEPDWGKMVNTGAIIPNYASSTRLAKVGLDSRGFRRILRNAIRQKVHHIEDPLPPDTVTSARLVDRQTALEHIHFPTGMESLEKARTRLKFEELFFLQFMLALRRHTFKGETGGIAFQTESPLARSLLDHLPFELTDAQRKVLREIAGDMSSPAPMHRLLQGDVGSGKTIVALFAMLVAVENGYQAAFMAPTEILAEQHFHALRSFLRDLPVSIRLLLGGQRKRLREEILESVRSGEANIVVGTHALIEEQVRFHNLGFVVIDEQHRFGVLQRAELKRKGLNPDVLVMTATPIPRTLSMTLYGDLDVSVLDQLPAHRKPVRTAVRSGSQKDRVFDFIRTQIQNGQQAYIVFPLIEASEKIDLKAATREFDRLQRDEFPNLRLGLLHGRLKSDEKEEIMTRFRDKAIDILVATTVIEVGIDVPNATVMVIENAERFGLSQLHQLRGRVGRGAEQSYCILMTDDHRINGRGKADTLEGQTERVAAHRRLNTMVETSDGFKIAEVDLELRGPGEFFGTRQSGIPELRIADLVGDRDLLQLARDLAFDVVARDPQLRAPEQTGLRRYYAKHLQERLKAGSIG